MPLALMSPRPRMRPPVDTQMKRGFPFRPVLQNFGDAPLHVASDAHAARASVDVTESEIGISFRYLSAGGLDGVELLSQRMRSSLTNTLSERRELPPRSSSWINE